MTHKTLHFIRHFGEMVIAMLVGMFALGGAFALLLAPLGIDVGDWQTEAPTLLAIQHIAMLPAMLVAMLLRRDEYTGQPGRAAAVR